MKALNMAKWSLDGFDTNYNMYRMIRRDSDINSCNEYLLVSGARLIIPNSSRKVYLKPTKDPHQAKQNIDFVRDEMIFETR